MICRNRHFMKIPRFNLAAHYRFYDNYRVTPSRKTIRYALIIILRIHPRTTHFLRVVAADIINYYDRHVSLILSSNPITGDNDIILSMGRRDNENACTIRADIFIDLNIKRRTTHDCPPAANRLEEERKRACPNRSLLRISYELVYFTFAFCVRNLNTNTRRRERQFLTGRRVIIRIKNARITIFFFLHNWPGSSGYCVGYIKK